MQGRGARSSGAASTARRLPRAVPRRRERWSVARAPSARSTCRGGCRRADRLAIHAKVGSVEECPIIAIPEKGRRDPTRWRGDLYVPVTRSEAIGPARTELVLIEARRTSTICEIQGVDGNAQVHDCGRIGLGQRLVAIGERVAENSADRWRGAIVAVCGLKHPTAGERRTTLSEAGDESIRHGKAARDPVRRGVDARGVGAPGICSEIIPGVGVDRVGARDRG